MMSLAILPCSEVINVCLFDISQTDLAEMQNQMPDDDHCGDSHDHCSPFCICDCCGASMLKMDLPIDSTVKLIPPTTAPSIFRTLVSNPEPGDIWQPPKFS